MNNQNSELSFDDTQLAFAYKNDNELRQARMLFSIMGNNWMLQAGLKLTPWAIRFKIPFTGSLIRATIFRQFVGGETLEKTVPVVKKLEAYQTKVILDYGVEGGEGEKAFDASTEEFRRVIEFASTHPNIPFISIKVTGIARFSLLEKIQVEMSNQEADTLMKKYTAAIQQLESDEQEEWSRVVGRLSSICSFSCEKKVGVLVDAEESWIQDPVDALTILMMDLYNHKACYIYNTIQLYRIDRLDFLRSSHQAALDRGFILGAKLVRGAYMEKERIRATEQDYQSPIQLNKENTDRDFDEAVGYCISRLDTISVIIASHNENSNKQAVQLMKANNISLQHPHIHFSQLYGMSDNITFNLAQAGCGVSKYLPFGPIKDVIPYLMRRAQENSSVSGQTGRELALIEKELKRRRGEEETV